MTSVARLVPKSNVWQVPTFLCPIAEPYNVRALLRRSAPVLKAQCRRSHSTTIKEEGILARPLPVLPQSHAAVPKGEKMFARRTSPPIEILPWTCPGCGAYTQADEPDEAGFYSMSRKPVRALKAEQYNASKAQHLDTAGVEESEAPVPAAITPDAKTEPVPTPVCDRCHLLQHHHMGVSIEHPTLQSIRDMIFDSPYKHNHVYHILDAADFPMSLVPTLQKFLSLTPQRGKNRRSTADKHFHGAKRDMTFIITRSDLLAPRKEQVDAMMPYLEEVLRDALGSLGDKIRLGNIKCVSSHRGWWTRDVKEEVWSRGGGQWMVGKVNVGKSNLLESIYPKARNQDAKTLEQHVVSKNKSQGLLSGSITQPQIVENSSGEAESTEEFDPESSSLLPPMPKETAYPAMPVVSHLPGTTASPIRLPFGRGKGELIDLPGLARGNLEHLVLDEHKSSLVMQSRLKAPQASIKPGQSLVISNLIRITPTTPDLVFLACPFVPIDHHVTNTEKAQAILNQEANEAVKGIARPEVPQTIKSAGLYELSWNVTKARAGPLTRADAAAFNPERLHFVIFSTDILVEGVGWIELAAQVRRSALEGKDGEEASFKGFPTVEIFSPNGEHIGARKPMNAWMIGGHKRKPASQRTTRPRMSMKGMKKSIKRETRRLLAKGFTTDE